MTAKPLAIASRTIGIAVNPFFIYVLSFGGVTALYHLRWSAMYPSISVELWAFLIISCVISLLFGFSVRARLRKCVRDQEPIALSTFWCPLLVSIYIAEFVYAGGIPIYWVFSGQAYIYEEFGIPSVHVFVMTFGAFFSLVKYDEFLGTRGKRSALAFFWAILPILFALSIVNRAFVLINLVSWIFIFFLNRRPSLRRLSALFASTAFMLLAFGLLGDFRTASRNDQDLVENVILEIGDATEGFRESGIPPATFWAYIYATSPMANLQNTINLAKERVGPDNLVEFAVAELIPDFISKRILALIGVERVLPVLMTPALTVATVYAASFAYFGWVGMVIMFISLMLLTYSYVLLLKFNRFAIPSLAMVNTFIIFCIFDNMIYFSGISLQLAWPLLLSLRLSSSRPRTNDSTRHRSVVA